MTKIVKTIKNTLKMKTLLKNAREEKGLKTREVAQLLGIDQALISKFESGSRKPESLSETNATIGLQTARKSGLLNIVKGISLNATLSLVAAALRDLGSSVVLHW